MLAAPMFLFAVAPRSMSEAIPTHVTVGICCLCILAVAATSLVMLEFGVGKSLQNRSEASLVLERRVMSIATLISALGFGWYAWEAW